MVVITQQYLNTESNAHLPLMTILKGCDPMFMGTKESRLELFSDGGKTSSAKSSSRISEDRRLCIRYPSFFAPHARSGLTYESHCSLPRITSLENRFRNNYMRPTNGKEHKWQTKHHRADASSEPEELYRISMPCTTGCCYCVYANQLGPVRLYVSSYTPPRKEKTIQGIRDGKGRRVIPTSRKNDIKGLVYDQHSFSLHPPIKTNNRIMKYTQNSVVKDFQVRQNWHRRLKKSK